MFVRISPDLKPLVYGVWYWNEKNDYRGLKFEVKARKVRKYIGGKRVSLTRYDVIKESSYNMLLHPNLPEDRYISSLDCSVIEKDDCTATAMEDIEAIRNLVKGDNIVKPEFQTRIVTTKDGVNLFYKRDNRLLEIKDNFGDTISEAHDITFKKHTDEDTDVAKEIIRASSELGETGYLFHPSDNSAKATHISKDIEEIIASEKKEDFDMTKEIIGVSSEEWEAKCKSIKIDENSWMDIFGFTYYKHVKTGGLYRKVSIGRNSNNCKEEIVSYKALQETDFPVGQIWHRPKHNFYYPGRFRKLTFKEILMLWFGMRDNIK